MAHMKKTKMSGAKQLMKHNERSRLSTLERDNVDETRTRQNYELELSKKLENLGHEELLDRAVEHHNELGRNLRSDANVLCSWVVTAPQDLEPEREREFFENTKEFLQERYGEENLIGAYVHKDETTPHCHYEILPVKEGRFNAHDFVDRADLRSFHSDLSEHIERTMGREYRIEIPEEERGERELSKVPHEYLSQAQAELRNIDSELAERGERLERLRQREQSERARADELDRGMREARERQSEALQGERKLHEDREAFDKSLRKAQEAEPRLLRQRENFKERIEKLWDRVRSFMQNNYVQPFVDRMKELGIGVPTDIAQEAVREQGIDREIDYEPQVSREDMISGVWNSYDRGDDDFFMHR